LREEPVLRKAVGVQYARAATGEQANSRHLPLESLPRTLRDEGEEAARVVDHDAVQYVIADAAAFSFGRNTVSVFE
jgi:hypothetical protein